MHKEIILECKNLCKVYGQDKQAVNAVNNASMSIHKGDFCVITGKSGCGKSTLLRMLSGLERPSSGQVYFNDTDIYAADNRTQASLRGNHFGFVFQAFHLIPELSVYDNIALPRLLNRRKLLKSEVTGLAEQLDISEKLGSYPHELSGGQQQRVAIARAFINQPTILFADEPTGNLDENNRDIVLKILKSYSERESKAVVMVTHDRVLQDQTDIQYSMRDGVVDR